MHGFQTQTIFDKELAKRLPEFEKFEGKQVRISVEEVVERKERRPVFGAGAGHVHLSENWDAPIDDFEDYL